ncbi:MAG: glycosyltransferase [Paraclostridium sp.]
MKKKVLFLIRSLEGGGAEKVLVDIVTNLNKNKFDITVMTCFDRGIYIDKIKNSNVNYKYLFKNLKPSTNLIGKLNNIIKIKIQDIILKLSPSIIYKMFIKETYDIEIAFMECLSTRIISGSKNSYSKKYAWVHTDLIKNNWGLKYYSDIEEQKRSYGVYDTIFCVSESLKICFHKVFGMEDKIKTLYNPIDENDILEKSLENIDDIKISNKFKIISVGRLNYKKGYDRLLEVHNKLIKKGYEYELLIIGDEVDFNKLNTFILENNLSESVKLIGFRKNPYKYIKKADLFLCPSRVEGLSTVVMEAIVLNRPILTTNCPGMEEILGNSEYGMIVNNDSDSLFRGIESIINDRALYNYYKEKSLERSQYIILEKSIKDIENSIQY